MEDISDVSAIDSVIFILENKMENTQEFFLRKELKEKIEQAIKDKEIILSKQTKEDIEIQKEIDRKNKIDKEISERNKVIKDKIKSYI